MPFSAPVSSSAKPPPEVEEQFQARPSICYYALWSSVSRLLLWFQSFHKPGYLLISSATHKLFWSASLKNSIVYSWMDLFPYVQSWYNWNRCCSESDDKNGSIISCFICLHDHSVSHPCMVLDRCNWSHQQLLDFKFVGHKFLLGKIPMKSKKCLTSESKSRNSFIGRLSLKGGILAFTRYFLQSSCLFKGRSASSSIISHSSESSSLSGWRRTDPRWLGLAISAPQVKPPEHPLASSDLLLSLLREGPASPAWICCIC